MIDDELPHYIDFIDNNDGLIGLMLAWWYMLPNPLNDYEFSWR